MRQKKLEKEELLAKLKQIVVDEKFKVDAYFLCGAPSGLPNETLRKACEVYLVADAERTMTEEIRSVLIVELQKAAAKKDGLHIVGDLTNNQADIAEVLANQDLL